MRTIKTYCIGAPFYNAFLRTRAKILTPAYDQSIPRTEDDFCPLPPILNVLTVAESFDFVTRRSLAGNVRWVFPN